MKKRSVTNKNLLGGFLGGMCGILVFGLFHPAFLPVGVLLGVIIGWWYEDIFYAILRNVYESLVLAKRYCVFVENYLQKPQIKKTKKNGPSMVTRFLVWLLGIFIWVFMRPVALWKWFRSHPMNGAYFLRFLVMIVQAAFMIFVAYYLVGRYMPETFGGGFGSFGQPIPVRMSGPVDYLLFTLATALIPIVVMIVLLLACRAGGSKSFYKDFERYASMNSLEYFFALLANSIVSQVKVYLIFICAASYGVSALIVFLSVFLIPLLVFIGFIKSINEIIMRRGHWLCLAVTMTTTIMSAWMFGSYIKDIRMLWLVALGTGVSSAVLTEAIRRSLVWVFENTSRGRQYAAADFFEFIKDRLAPGGEIIVKGFEKISGNLLTLDPI